MKQYEFTEHTADIGLRAFGKNERELFLNAAYGFFDLITDLKSINTKIEYSVEIEGETLEELFFNWLDELLFLFDAKGFLAKDIRLEKLTQKKLKATLKGEKFNPKKHPIENQIKAVTYHDFKLICQNDQWLAEVLFDI